MAVKIMHATNISVKQYYSFIKFFSPLSGLF